MFEFVPFDRFSSFTYVCIPLCVSQKIAALLCLYGHKLLLRFPTLPQQVFLHRAACNRTFPPPADFDVRLEVVSGAKQGQNASTSFVPESTSGAGKISKLPIADLRRYSGDG